MSQKTLLLIFSLLLILFSLLFLGFRQNKKALPLRASAAEIIVEKTGKPLGTAKFVGKTTSLSLASQGEAKKTDSFGQTIVPTMLGSLSEYTGAATFVYPFLLPKGPARIAPQLGLSYSSQSIDDARAGNSLWKETYALPPSLVGAGFQLTGFGSIIRDTRGRKDVPILGNEIYHRFIVNLPSGSYELKYNPDDHLWVSIPQGFLKIEHSAPNSEFHPPGFDYPFVDTDPWKITTKDGTVYYFGDEKLEDMLRNTDAGSAVINKATVVDDDSTPGKKRSIGGKLGTEYDFSERCDGPPENPCAKSENRKPKALVARKWNLRKVETTVGQGIFFTYEAHQKRLSSGEFVSTASYPLTVSWNDDKYRAQFVRENRPDKGIEEDVKERIKEVFIDVKVDGYEENDGYQLARKYVLSYHKSGDYPPIPEENFSPSMLASIQLLGSNNNDHTPPVTFDYQTVGDGGANALYLREIHNGYGGITTYDYERFAVAYKTKDNKGDNTASGRWGSERVRVSKKTVKDSVYNKQAEQNFVYPQDKIGTGFAETLGDSQKEEDSKCTGCFPPTGLQFLGHKEVMVRETDFDGLLVSQKKLEFFQATENDGCFQPHPAKGFARQTILFDENTPVRITTNQYNYWLTGDDNHDPNLCKDTLLNQPYFVYLIRTDSEKSEARGALNDSPSSLHSAIEYRQYDKFGNVRSFVELGEIDKDGNDKDTSDNRYHVTNYVVDDKRWILGLPAVNYVTTKSACTDEVWADCQHERTEMIYDGNGESHNQTLSKGLLTEKRLILGKEKLSKEVYRYDEAGNLIETLVAEPNQETTKSLVTGSKTSYDAFYHALAIKTIEQDGRERIFENYNVLLQLPQIIKTKIDASPAGFSQETLEYDSLGRVTKVFAPDHQSYNQSQDLPALTKQYLDNDNRLIIRTSTLSSATPGALESKSTYNISDLFYDGFGNQIQYQILQSVVDGQAKRLVYSSAFNVRGQLTKEYEVEALAPSGEQTLPSYHPLSSSPLKETSYDALDRVRSKKEKDPLHNQSFTTTFAYFSNGRSTTLPTGIEQIVENDVWERSLVTTLRSRTESRTTQNFYDQALIDKPTRTEVMGRDTAGEKAVSAYTYDDWGNLLTMNDPSLGKYIYTYDSLGNKIKEDQGKRGSITWRYDHQGRLVRKDYSTKLYPTKSLRQHVQYTYDSGENAYGKLVNVEDPTGNTSYVYDKGQRLIKTSKRIFDKTEEFASEYNSLSQTIHFRATGAQVDYDYDAENRLKKITVDQQPLLVDTIFNKEGKPTRATIGLNGKTYQGKNDYDPLGKLHTLAFQGDNPIFSQTYRYADTSLLDALDETLKDQSQTFSFTYDAMAELASVRGNNKQNADYKYDEFGRLIEKKESEQKTYSYNSSLPFFGPKEINAGDSVQKIVYDDHGEIVSDGLHCFAYNLDGKLTQIRQKCNDAQNTTTTDLFYDFAGKLVATFSKDEAKYFFGAVEEIIQNNGTPTKRFSLELSPYIEAVKQDNQWHLVLKDYLSSTRLIQDSQGQVIVTPSYFPYGQAVDQKIIDGGLPTDNLFTGQRRVTTSGLYDFGARSYHPLLGIFLQPDPIEGPNRFAYAANNPAMFSDPSGNAFSIGEVGGETDSPIPSTLTYTTSQGSSTYSTTTLTNTQVINLNDNWKPPYVEEIDAFFSTPMGSPWGTIDDPLATFTIRSFYLTAVIVSGVRAAPLIDDLFIKPVISGATAATVTFVIDLIAGCKVAPSLCTLRLQPVIEEVLAPPIQAYKAKLPQKNLQEFIEKQAEKYVKNLTRGELNATIKRWIYGSHEPQPTVDRRAQVSGEYVSIR